MGRPRAEQLINRRVSAAGGPFRVRHQRDHLVNRAAKMGCVRHHHVTRITHHIDRARRHFRGDQRHVLHVHPRIVGFDEHQRAVQRHQIAMHFRADALHIGEAVLRGRAGVVTLISRRVDV